MLIASVDLGDSIDLESAGGCLADYCMEAYGVETDRLDGVEDSETPKGAEHVGCAGGRNNQRVSHELERRSNGARKLLTGFSLMP